jgi:FlaA1/EpsC-like NDP-sugar epimerase/UDP-N-acetylmuramyl pentapeptide phosphotransferase/UDP-N-acetylglucosamine-1-phosphate transferase
MFDTAVILLLCFCGSAAICFGVTKGKIASPHSSPSERSLHSHFVFRGGGLGIACGVLFFVVFAGLPWSVTLAFLMLWCVSAWDDWASTRASLRLLIQALAAMLLAVTWLTSFSPALLFLSVISLIWCLNLFNFMDGADGVAAATAVMSGLALTGLWWVASDSATSANVPTLVLLALATSASALGFLIFNVPPARIFMGDGGSTLLGFVLAAISIKGWHDGLWPLAAPVALFVPFWADATYTLIRRVLQGHNPLVPHRDNLYQRLVLSGLGHQGLLAWIVGWNLISVVVAFVLISMSNVNPGVRTALALIYGAAYVAFAHWAARRPPANLLLNPRASLALVYDLLAVAVAWSALFWARFNFNFDAADYSSRDLMRSLAFVVPVHALIFISLGLYRGLWRFASLTDLWLIVRAAFVAAATTAVLFTIVRPDSFIWPRTVLVLQPLLLIVLMGGARLAYRSWKEHRLYGLSAAKGDPVIVLGAGAAGARLVNELKKSETWRAVALLDDDSAKIGARLHDAPVVGSIDQAAIVAKRFGARHAIIAMPNAHHDARRRAVSIAAEAGLSTLTVPAYDELLSDNEPLARLRAIELEDLLGRDPVSLDTEGLANWFGNKTVLITGAGGSIGHELCAQVARFAPRRLVMVDISEFAAHVVSEHITSRLDASKTEVYVADVRNANRMREIFAVERPAIVFHAAAYKHVPLTETVNAWEAVRNNTLGTIITAQCAREFAAEKFVLVSTDKAVRASSIMGASKRLAELACMSFAESPTQFVAVRFGNVLGSNGSVIPKFRKQIDAGGPITVTHRDMTRFFMSIPEAAQLVLQAGLIGEARSLYVLDMGAPVKILDLARELIRLAKGRVDAIPIVFTGLRRGEKMHEELLGEHEQFASTRHEKVRRVMDSASKSVDLSALVAWLEGVPPQEIRSELQRWVTDFKPPVA